MNGAEILVAMLQAYKVEVIFGLPGDTGTAFYDALRAQDIIRHVLTRDERSAGFMADSYARLSGKPGVCEGPSGGGATYILPGVAEAHHSAIPFLVITTDNALSLEHQGALTELDQESLFRPVTKWSAEVKRAELIPHMVRRAFRLMTTARTGAVHLSIPKDILEASVDAKDLWADPQGATYPAYRFRPDSLDVERAAELLSHSEHPVIICGGGVHLSRAYAEVQELAELLAAPVATSINGKGALAESHPLSLGVVGSNGGRAFAHNVIRAGDLVLVVGSRTNYVTTHSGLIPPKNFHGKVLQIDADGAEIGNNLRIDAGLAGDARLALRDLIAALKADSRDLPRLGTARTDHLARAREAWWGAESAKASSNGIPIRPQTVMSILRDLLPDDAVIVADPGTATPFVAAHYPLPRAGRFTVIPRAHGGLGYGIPAVLGAKVARPDSTVLCLTGDGSFGFSVGELETAVRLNLQVVVIQFSNGTFGWIKELQHLHHNDRYFGVNFLQMDCATIARSFGWHGIQVQEPGRLAPAIREALAIHRPAFVDVLSADQVAETPPVIDWEEAEAKRAHKMAVSNNDR
jgi:acetolactate synthase I/II/III large subunit